MGEYLLPSSFTFRATSIPSPQRFSCFHFFLLDRDHSVAAETRLPSCARLLRALASVNLPITHIIAALIQPALLQPILLRADRLTADR